YVHAMFCLLLLLGIIGGLTKALSPHRGPSAGNSALSPEDEYCQSLCGSPPTSICGDKGSYFAHPTGLYVDGGHQRGTYYRVSVSFNKSSTVLDHLNITIFGFPPAFGEGLPYSMAGNRIVILDYNSIPEAARPLAKREL
ncbi:hypothetical protein FOL46_003480, partial [Perkinsus olseni]